VIASNNSARPASDIVERLTRLGAPVDVNQVLTSAQATAMYLPRLASPGARVLLVGGEGIADELTRAGYQVVDREAEVVVVGMDLNLTFDKLKRATLEIRRGAKFVGTNPDRTFPSEVGLVPGAGAIIAAVEAATDVAPTIIGKPERALFDLAIQKMGGVPEATAMLGDRLETDIEGARRAGLAAILVLTGVTSRQLLAASLIQPDFVYADLDALRKAWERDATY
jgi:4-nitrophenyl phosphatase